MLLTVDVGNTNTVLGLFEDHELAHSWRITTHARGTADEMALTFRGLLTEVPDVTGIAPEYEQKRFEPEEKRGRLLLVASPDGANGSVRMHQDARLFIGLLDGAERTALEVAPGRRLYVHVARGKVTANGEALDAGDALKLTDTPVLILADGVDAEVLVFDLPE